MHTVLRLLQNDHLNIIGLDNINDYYEVQLKYDRLKNSGIPQDNVKYGQLIQSNIYAQYKFIQLNLEDTKAVTTLFAEQKFDYVISLGAQAGVRYSIQQPYSYIDSNIVGFMTILENCRQHNIQHLVYASTSSVYGLNRKLPFAPTDSTDHPMSLYAATKKANEMMAHSYSHLYRIPTTGLRFFTVYGPWGRPDMALFKFTKAILNNQPIDVYHEGKMLRDFTYVDDIVENVYRIMLQPATPNLNWQATAPNSDSSSAPYRIVNIGNNQPILLNEYIAAIEQATGKQAQKNMLPMQPGDVPDTHADVSSLEAITGFRPQTPVKEGVKKFVDWYLGYYG